MFYNPLHPINKIPNLRISSHPARDLMTYKTSHSIWNHAYGTNEIFMDRSQPFLEDFMDYLHDHASCCYHDIDEPELVR